MDQLQEHVLDPLKPYLLPITTNLPGPLNSLALNLLGEPCHSALLLDLDFAPHPECVSLAISKALGIGIITASSVVKVPQILKLVRSHSSEGLSFSSYLLETASFVISLAYNIRNKFPFSTYGETSLIAVQDVVISVLILAYSGRSAQAGTFLVAVGSAVYALMVSETLVSESQMTTLQAGAGALSIASKLPQILTVYSQGGTGQLSAFAVFNYLFGSLTRIYTTLQEVDDKLILYGFVAGLFLNAVLAVQMLYYWNSPTTAGHGKEVGGAGGKKKGPQGVAQKGSAALATEETIKKAPGTPATTTARPNSSSGRRRA
ncbi:mannose-P-dolichol utilization defect 1 [Exophiala aquamarina CBS 119918]|uniref:Mannose-P-dolichol utilization defect 1 n=1 Tax=Exophiala aquamarina CBS 119918 TaxID=1182545 RepID=A0A072PTW8_9EURO|nr:mannose-P-dolichol utilization defect 1 [Exophiala aquamarina CBS 119918]KEF63271.1 mannose-P-dolichol utilization defect 1 [Exophiala aquamarina CBS 119918]